MNQQPEIKLLIGIPSMGQFQDETALCLAYLTADLSFPLKGFRSHVWHVLKVNTSKLYSSRQYILDTALKEECTHLLFLDTDMVFPPQTARGLLSHREDVIAANCVSKHIPAQPTAYGFDRKPMGFRSPIQLQSEPGLLNVSTLREVWRVGTGIMMLSRKAMLALPRPAFTPYWDEQEQDYVGEDWAMLDHLEKAGFRIKIDMELSAVCGHVGKKIYSPEDSEL